MKKIFLYFILLLIIIITLIISIFLIYYPNQVINQNILLNKNNLFLIKLESNGLVLVNHLSQEQINLFRTFFYKGKVNYLKISQNILPIIKQKVDQVLGWDLRFNTYRVSNGKHLVGASGFHRDQFDYSQSKTVPPLFTILVYLDSAKLEYLPKSHIYRTMNPITAYHLLSNKSKVINIVPGSIFVMYGTTIHRAIKNKFEKNRRLLQFFGTIPNQYLESKWKPSVILKSNNYLVKKQSQWVKYVLPIFNFFYTLQQTCRFEILGARNYIPIKFRKNKLVIPHSMPIRKNKENDENLYIIINQSNFQFY